MVSTPARVQSHVGLKEYDEVENLAKEAHLDEAPTILLGRYVEARLLIRVTLRLHYPDVRIAMGVLLPPVRELAPFEQKRRSFIVYGAVLPSKAPPL